jgi:alkylation response protein AidB-like acyl-CoA dehydrogenase
MNFDLSEGERRLQDEAGRLAGDIAKDGFTGEADAPRTRDLLGRLLPGLGAAGYLEGLLDAPASRPHAGAVARLVAGMEIAARSPALYLALAADLDLFGWLVARFFQGEERERILAPLAAGKMTGCVALHEHAGNFDGGHVALEGAARVDDRLLSGRKCHVVLAPAADLLAVVGKDGGEGALFLVEAGQEGVRIGPALRTAGFGSLPVADVSLEGCLVGRGRVAKAGDGAALAALVAERENLVLSTAAVGVMQRAFDAARAFADEAEGGRRPAMAYQENRFRLAEMFTLLRTSRLMLDRAAWMLQENQPQASTVNACAKVFVTESAEQVASIALRVMGKAGTLMGNRAEESLRDSKFTQAAGQSCEALRMLVADDCLAQV